MENEDRRKGIPGLTGLFRESVAKVPDGSRIVFTGSVGGCSPIAELLALAVRKRGFEMYFAPTADLTEGRPILWQDGAGFTVRGGRVELTGTDVFVILGGLAIPDIGRPIEEVEAVYEHLGRPRLIGVSFMGILRRNGWTERLPFDSIIDCHIDTGFLSKER